MAVGDPPRLRFLPAAAVRDERTAWREGTARWEGVEGGRGTGDGGQPTATTGSGAGIVTVTAATAADRTGRAV